MAKINTIIQGDVIEVLKTLESESVQCVITSPPYWGLRDYFGCDCGTKRYFDSQGDGTGGAMNYRKGSPLLDCVKCNGTGRLQNAEIQIGLEKTPEEYVSKMVSVFAEVRRVLRKDGVMFLNLGDSYAGSCGNGYKQTKDAENRTNAGGNDESLRKITGRSDGALKPKDLCGIPWRVAFALQANGWWLRQDIIWAKPNPMPESVTDRCTKSHEYIFLLTKSASYYYDAEAISEPAMPEHFSRYKYSFNDGAKESSGGGRPDGASNTAGMKKLRPHGIVRNRELGYDSKENAMRGKNNLNLEGKAESDLDSPEAIRNKRSVWTITTKPFSDAHFAVFPEEIPLNCIKAGSKEGDLILDPFSGAGTTCMVAKKLNRRYIGIELNEKYCQMARDRIETECGTLF